MLREAPRQSAPDAAELVRDRAPVGTVTVTRPEEPGTPLRVRGLVRDEKGRPVAGALVHAYHTSEKGWYSDRAPHIASDNGQGGDIGHARLFVDGVMLEWLETTCCI